MTRTKREVDINRHLQYLYPILVLGLSEEQKANERLSGEMRDDLTSRVTALFADLPPTVEPVVDDFGLLYLVPRYLSSGQQAVLDKHYEGMLSQTFKAFSDEELD